jgi:hypothetical protein
MPYPGTASAKEAQNSGKPFSSGRDAKTEALWRQIAKEHPGSQFGLFIEPI